MININNEVGIKVEKASGCVLLAWHSELWRQGIGMVTFDSYTLETSSVKIMCLSS